MGSSLIKSSPLLHDASYGVFRTNVEGRILEVNSTLATMLGYDSEEELLALSMPRDVYRDPASRQLLVKQITEAGHVEGVEIDWKRKDGTPITVMSSGRVVRDDGGVVIQFEGIVHDVTRHKQMEERLRKSEEWFRSLIELGASVYAVLDPQGNVLYESPSVQRVYGWSPEELLGKSIFQRVHPDDVEYATQNFREVVEKPGHVKTIEIRYRRQDGSWRLVEVTAINLLENPAVGGIVVNSHDVTHRRQAEQALRESESKLRSLFENMPDFVLMVDRNAIIQFANHAAPGEPPGELVGSRGFDFIAPEHQEACRRALEETFETREVQAVEMRTVFDHWWACRLIPMIEEDQVRNVMIICTDVTQSKAASEAVQKEQRLLRQLLDLHERDRQLIAYEIHDGFAQQLTGARFHLEAFARLHGEFSEEAGKIFHVALQLLGESIDETRRLISGLRPPVLDESGIVAAIDYLVCEIQERDGLEIDFSHEVDFDRLTPPLESAIFRIVQESLTNACRHSHSKKIRVELVQRDGRIRVGVRDWGIGFDPQCIKEHRFGLQGIRQRARLLGGEVVIETGPDQGTHVIVDLPLVEPARKPDQA